MSKTNLILTLKSVQTSISVTFPNINDVPQGKDNGDYKAKANCSDFMFIIKLFFLAIRI